jgi:hypothetical protein
MSDSRPPAVLCRLTFCALLVASLAALGCGEDPEDLPPGQIAVSWLVGTSGCTASNIDKVAIFLADGSSATTVHTFDCEDGEVGGGGGGGVVISSVRPGTYDLVLRGRDADGFDRFGATYANVVVRSEGTASVSTVRLSALRATIRVSWYFDNGRLCDYNDVETVEATLFEDEYIELTQSAPCDAGLMEIEDIEAGSYTVDLVGRDDAGRLLYNGQDSLVVDKGDYAEADIRLDTIEE